MYEKGRQNDETLEAARVGEHRLSAATVLLEPEAALRSILSNTTVQNGTWQPARLMSIGHRHVRR